MQVPSVSTSCPPETSDASPAVPTRSRRFGIAEIARSGSDAPRSERASPYPSPAFRATAEGPTLTTADGTPDRSAPHSAQDGAEGEQRHSGKRDASQGCREGRAEG